MKFLIDAPLPPVFAKAFSNAGLPAKHLRDVDLRHSSDSVIWAYAARHEYVIVTKDRDFADRTARAPHGPSVVWLRIGNGSNAQLMKRVLPLLPSIFDRLAKGERLVVVI